MTRRAPRGNVSSTASGSGRLRGVLVSARLVGPFMGRAGRRAPCRGRSLPAASRDASRAAALPVRAPPPTRAWLPARACFPPARPALRGPLPLRWECPRAAGFRSDAGLSRAGLCGAGGTGVPDAAICRTT